MSSFLKRVALRPILGVCLFLLTCLQGHALADTHLVSHAMGETEVPETPQRIVTLYQGATDSAVALGIKPVGVVESWAQKPIYDYLRDDLNGVEVVGLETQPNLEVIARLQPDLIIAAKVRHEKIYRQLTQIAPTVMADTVYDFERSLALVAEATGYQAEGEKLWQAWQKRTADFRQQLSVQQSKWPLTASILNARADHMRIYLQESFPGAVLDDIGFASPMPEQTGWGVKLKTKEALPSVNADVFFVLFDQEDGAVQQNYDNWRQHPLWQVLNAPRNDQVYQVNFVNWILSGGILGANLMLDELSELYHLAPAS
ncbi:ABC transporter substrate-binding protein [Marinomonas fungiae]|uniref:ABC transporter substrate-binding protein n=1 Tax=Marinomonas fungiae TaxID=1137284 RepID=UPI003A959BE5